ncbi:MAG: leucine-rich repeat domain-containing protein [Ruminococcaceae bacterium]|nr:leucine-rich repeat domain-containing protein [Oscillospiraceae bacterium]
MNGNENIQMKKLCESDEYYKEIIELCAGNTKAEFYPEFGEEAWKCTCGHTNSLSCENCEGCGVSSDKLRLYFSELFLMQRKRENEVRRQAEEKKRMEEEAEKWRKIDPNIENVYSNAQRFEPTRDNYLEAAKKLEAIKDYKDSASIAKKYRELAEDAPLYDKKTLAEMRGKKIRKWFNIALVFAAVLTVLYVAAYFTLIAPNGFKYKVVDGEVTITSYDQFFGGKNVVIPEEIFGKRVTAIGDYAFENCDAVISVKIPETVKTIGNGAFRNCDSVKTVIVPSSVTKIGTTAFSYCDNLTEVELYAQTNLLPMTLFRECTKLSTVIIDMPLEKIETGAFDKCRDIKVVKYSGTREEWEKIDIQNGNGSLLQAAVQYEYIP